MTTDQDTPLADQDAPLADTAAPRDDAGWHDLEAEQEPSWSVPDLPVRARSDADDEPEGFVAALDDAGDDDAPWSSPAASEQDVHDDDDDAPWSSPALPAQDPALPAQDEPSADAVTAEVHDALGDLLGNGAEDAVVATGEPVGGDPEPAVPQEAAAPAASGDSDVLDDFDHLDDLEHLEHLDDMAAAAVPLDADAAAPATEDEPAVEQPLDAPTAARKVMEPGSVTFSSGGKKKRGLFG